MVLLRVPDRGSCVLRCKILMYNVYIPVAVRLATLNAARVAGVKQGGVLEAGAPADLVVLSPNGEVRSAMVRGAGI